MQPRSENGEATFRIPRNADGVKKRSIFAHSSSFLSSQMGFEFLRAETRNFYLIPERNPMASRTSHQVTWLTLCIRKIQLVGLESSSHPLFIS